MTTQRNAVALLVSAALLCASAAAPAKQYVLSFKSLAVHRGERVVGFHIVGKNLMLDRVVNFPDGWVVHIETDPAGDTEISGTIIVGAAALDPSDIEHGWSFRDPPGTLRQDRPSLSGAISVTKTFDDEREVPLRTSMLVAKPDAQRPTDAASNDKQAAK